MSNAKKAAKPAAKRATTKKAAVKKAAVKKAATARTAVASATLPAPSLRDAIAAQPFVREQLSDNIAPAGFVRPQLLDKATLAARAKALGVKLAVSDAAALRALNAIDPNRGVAIAKLPADLQASLRALPSAKFHGTRFALSWFPGGAIASPCADKFGYLTPKAVRDATKLPFNATTLAAIQQLGDMMGNAGRDTGADTTIPAGFTYVGQFVDHDITFDVSSSLDSETDANTIHNMRSPSLDLDSLYGRGPALDPYLYKFPSGSTPTAIKFQLGSNTQVGPGGPSTGGVAGMREQRNWDVPRVINPLDAAESTHTAIIGDPRNNENLIVAQFHHAMLRFHNAVIDLLALAGFAGDHFVEAKKIVTHHYQWAVVHDFLHRVCGTAAVDAALASVSIRLGAAFRMPVEFSVAAYRFGHSMIRNNYWVNHTFINATLAQVFQFASSPQLPVFSNWVVDFNAFFETGIPVPVNNKARPIDSVLANGLESLPGFSGMMQVLATRNLRRGVALGLPSGQGVASHFGIAPLTNAQLKQGLAANEIAVLDGNGGLLLQKTPLWYYVLREAAVLESGQRLGPVGARIVAETFVRMLKRDSGSYLNVAGGFVPMLPSAVAGQFTFADLLHFAGVTRP